MQIWLAKTPRSRKQSANCAYFGSQSLFLASRTTIGEARLGAALGSLDLGAKRHARDHLHFVHTGQDRVATVGQVGEQSSYYRDTTTRTCDSSRLRFWVSISMITGLITKGLEAIATLQHCGLLHAHGGPSFGCGGEMGLNGNKGLQCSIQLCLAQCPVAIRLLSS